jgi:hypothetical protein
MSLPAENAYDREVVFEEAEFAARRHGAAGLKIGRTAMRVSCSQPQNHIPCARCGASIRLISYFMGRQRLCALCAKHAVR